MDLRSLDHYGSLTTFGPWGTQYLAAWIQTGIIVFLSTVRPEVYMSARQVKNNLKLSCLATGFHLKEITMNIRSDGHLVDRDDGLQSTGVRPNGDGTHQIKMWVMIPGGDTAKYTCEVNHPASNMSVVEEWDHHVDPVATSSGTHCLMGPIVGAAVGLLVVLGVIITGVVIILRRRRTPAEKVVTILPLHKEHQTLLTVQTVRELPGNNGEEKEPLKGPGSEASSGFNSGIGSGSNDDISDCYSDGVSDDISHGSRDGSRSSLDKPPV